MRIKFTIIIVAIFIFISLFITGCSNNKPISKTEFCLDTYVTLTIYEKSKDDLLDEAFKLCKEYESIISKTSETGDIKKLEKNRFKPVEISKYSSDIISIYKDLYDKSEHLLDYTIGNVSSLWNFKDNNKNIPDEKSISEAIKTIDFNSLVLENNIATLNSENAQLDFGAVAKGYISDLIKNFLIDKGIKSAVLNFGGNVVTIGSRPDGKPFKIGIYKPFTDNGEVIGSIKVKNTAVVTAGTYQRFFESDGKIYHHILNPKTGFPVESNLSSVTIITKDAAKADAYSTICILLGLEKAKDLINRTPDMEAVFITNDEHIETTSNNIIELK